MGGSDVRIHPASIVPCSPQHHEAPGVPSRPTHDAPELLRQDSSDVAKTGSIAESVGSAISLSMSPRKTKNERSVLRGEYRNHDNCMGHLEESVRFQNATLVVIVVNALWIIVDTQWNHKSLADPYPHGPLPLEPYSLVVENLFCAYFTVEVVVRFLALRGKCNLFWDGWFMFDTVLVLLMVFETWAMPLLAVAMHSDAGGAQTGLFSSMRLLRLLRLTRMARLMRYFPELMTLVKGMISATQAVGFILVFLIMVTYVFAILFTVQLGRPDTPEVEEGEDQTAAQMFSDLGSSMMTLFTNGMLGDNLYSTLVIIRHDSVILMWVFILYFLISSMTLLNMLIGVLCAVIEDTAKEEAEARSLWEMRRTIRDAFESTERSVAGDAEIIYPADWLSMRGNANLRGMFEGQGVEKGQLDDRLDQLQETLFGKPRASISSASSCARPASHPGMQKGMHFETFMDKVVDLKWDQNASTLDLEVLKSQAAQSDKDIRRRLMGIERAVGDALDVLSPEALLPAAPVTTAAGSGEDRVLTLSRCSTDGGLPAERGGDWLKQVPTELLFHVLKSRAVPT